MPYLLARRLRAAQPQRIVEIARTPLTHGLMFAVYPLGNGVYDAWSRQRVTWRSAAATGGPRGSGSGKGGRTRGVLEMWNTGDSHIQFPTYSTGLDRITGPCTLWAEGRPPSSGTGTLCYSAYSGTGDGVGMRFDRSNNQTNGIDVRYNNAGDYPTAWDSLGGSSELYLHRCGVSLDGTYAKFWTFGQLWEQKANTSLPAAHTSRKVWLYGNWYNTDTDGNAIGLTVLLAWARALSASEHAALYDNPWQVFEPDSPRWHFVPAAAGGGVYAVSLAESATAADAVSSVATLGAALAESAAAADTITAASLLPSALSESGAASDALSGLVTAVAVLTESGSAADTHGGALARVGALTEAGSATDSPSATLTAVAALTESGAASDAVASVATLIAALSEAGAATDVISAGGGSLYSVAIVETAAAADTVSSVLQAIAALSEAGSAQDAHSALMIAVAALAEGGTALDTLTGLLTRPAALSESGSATDTHSATLGAGTYPVSLAESASAADTLAAVLQVVGPLVESGAAADTLSARWSGQVSLAEIGSALDVLTLGAQFEPQTTRLVIVRAHRIVIAGPGSRTVH